MTCFTVLISVFEKENPVFFNESLESIWDLQVKKPNQIVLIKDGKLTQALEDVITSWQQKLGNIIEVISLVDNVGLGAALNEGLKYCKHELVARMDTDDVSLPNRFQKQVEFMVQNPEIMASSAILEEWDLSLNKKLSIRNLPLIHEEIVKFAKYRSPLSHPLVIFRKSIILKLGGYPNLRKAQDYALWSVLLLNGYRMANLPDILIKMRTGNEMMARRGFDFFKYEVQLLQFQKKIGFISPFQFYLNLILKGGLRLSPNIVKKIAYKFVR